MPSPPGPLITKTDDLAALCKRLRNEAFVTVDTEFLREKTYWPQLCLVQLGGAEEAEAVDALANGIDLTPLYELLADESVLKVFHAARQDVEIFVKQSGRVPAPLFDTQVAAMVCGFGDQVAYDTLVRKLAGESIDKSSRFTDWSARPLRDKQIAYALSDVTHLRPVYEKLAKQLEKTGREPWVGEEMAVLTDPATYRVEPEDAWRRLKYRHPKPRFLAILQAIAAWREETAQRRDIPRNRVLRDEALLEIAAHPPKSAKDLARIRGLSKGLAEGRQGKAILDAVARGLDLPEEEAPKPPARPDLPPRNQRGNGAVIDLLRVLLKRACETHDVAQKLVANAQDLELIAAGFDDVPALHGWRRQVFGDDALRLMAGDIALRLRDGEIELTDAG